MTPWILILFIFAGQPAVTTQEFSDEAACRQALQLAQAVKSTTRANTDIQGVCVPKQ